MLSFGGHNYSQLHEQVSGAARRAEALYERLVVMAGNKPGGPSNVSSAGLPSSSAETSMYQGSYIPAGNAAPESAQTAGDSWQAQGPSSTAAGHCLEAQQALYAYATFCLRCGHERHGRAEQALRSALGLPVTQCSTARPGGGSGRDGHGVSGAQDRQNLGSSEDSQNVGTTEVSAGKGVHSRGEAVGQPRSAVHLPSLLALAALLLHHGQVTDSMLLEEAADLARQVGRVFLSVRVSTCLCAFRLYVLYGLAECVHLFSCVRVHRVIDMAVFFAAKMGGIACKKVASSRSSVSGGGTCDDL